MVMGKDHRMTTAALHRAPDRSAAITYRCSPTEREELRQRAADLGISVQIFIARCLGHADGTTPERKPGPRHDPQQEEVTMP